MPPFLVRYATVAPQPWKNGGGVTRELWREPAGGEFDLRLSIAQVDRDGPFSLFPGVVRVLTLLEGTGFRLSGPRGTREVTRVGAPIELAGEDAWDCALLAGPVLDFNVMVRRGRKVTVACVGEGPLPPSAFALALLDGVQLQTAAEVITLSRYDLAWGEGVRVLLAPPGGVLVVTFNPLVAG